MSRYRCIVAIAAACALPPPATAQTCGWDAMDIIDGRPLSISALAARGGERVRTEWLTQVSSWVSDCSEPPMRSATLELRRVTDRNPRDPVLSALYGILLARGPEVQPPTITGLYLRPVHTSTNAEREAARRLAAVVEEQGWIEVAHELHALAMATRGEQTLRLASRALAAAAPETHDRTIIRLLADVELARGEYASASKAALQARESGVPASRVLGIALMMQGNAADGAGTYLQGIAGADRVELQAYLEDLKPLLTPPELEQLPSLSPDSLGAWIVTGWEWRAAIATLTVPERVVLHFQRLEHALSSYRRSSTRGAARLSGLWTLQMRRQTPLDDRGIIYVRHGEPDRTAALTSSGGGSMFGRIAWYYRRLDGGRAIFEFEKDPNVPDYRLADPTRSCLAVDNALQRESYEMQLRAMNALWSRGCFATVAGDTGTVDGVTGMHEIVRRTFASAFHTETAEPSYSRPLDVATNIYTFRDDSALSHYLITYIDGAALESRPADGGYRYVVPLFAAAEDPGARTVSRSDTVLRLVVPEKLSQGAVIAAVTHLASRPADVLNVRVSVRDSANPDIGQIGVASRDVSHIGEAGPGLSDIVIAQVAGRPMLQRAELLRPAQGHVVREGEAFILYYEMYGASPDERTTTLTIVPFQTGRPRPLDELLRDGDAVKLTFTEDGTLLPGRVGIASSQRISPSLPPGRYELVLEVMQGETRLGARTDLVVVGR